MRLTDRHRATAEENPAANAPRRWRRRAAVVALSAVMLGGLPAASAGASTPTITPSSIQAAQGDPECQGQASRCWEYYSWYWTYASCQETGRQQLADNAARYDDYNCQGDHGLVVWLWLHRK